MCVSSQLGVLWHRHVVAHPLDHTPGVPGDPLAKNRPTLDDAGDSRGGLRVHLRPPIQWQRVPQLFGDNMEIPSDRVGAAGDTDTPESLTNRRPEYLKLLTGNTGDHRAGICEDVGDNEADDKRNPLIWC